jgi:hypothetical protein
MSIKRTRIFPRSNWMHRRRFLQTSGMGALGFAALAVTFRATPAQGASTSQATLTVEDTDGVLGRAAAPTCVSVTLPSKAQTALREGRLVLKEQAAGAHAVIPAQRVGSGPDGAVRACWLMPPGSPGRRVFHWEETRQPSAILVQASRDSATGQYEVSEAGRPLLRYNYATVEPGDVLKDIAEGNRKYAVARSDYIHPLYGLENEPITKDWPVEHPHHRGIYWAWPEVDWHGQRGDLHALQLVFARPTGKCGMASGAVFAQIEAENEWRWGDRVPIVRERAIIRAYCATARGRYVDLDLRFEALGDPVLLARRGAEHYGGLNIRLAAVRNQQLVTRTGVPGSEPRQAWSDLAGTFAGAVKPSGLAVFQHAANPQYPGDWISYPELNWLQPTFPASGKRNELKKDQPLALKFRLWIHPGERLAESDGGDQWQAANSPSSPLA